MKIHCLGTAGYHPNDTRQTSCYYLPEAGIALDAGTGTYRLPKVLAGKSLNILLSHAHLDHTAGLTFLLDVLANHPLEQIQIWGESDKLAAVREHLFHPLIFPAPLDACWNPIDDAAEFVGADLHDADSAEEAMSGAPPDVEGVVIGPAPGAGGTPPSSWRRRRAVSIEGMPWMRAKPRASSPVQAKAPSP